MNYCIVCGKEFTGKSKNPHVCPTCEQIYLGKKVISILTEGKSVKRQLRYIRTMRVILQNRYPYGEKFQLIVCVLFIMVMFGLIFLLPLFLLGLLGFFILWVLMSIGKVRMSE